MSVASTILGQIDRMAKIRQASQANASTGDDFWTRVDAAADETYENRVKGSDMTALDSALLAGAFWSTATLKKWFDLHNVYFSNDLALSGNPLLAAYLDTLGGIRIPFEAAECFNEAMYSRLASQYVFPKGTRPADTADPATSGMHKFGRITGTAGAPTYASTDGAISSYVKGAGMLIINTDASPAPNSLVMTCTQQLGTTKDITVTLGGTDQYKQTILGAQAIGAAAAAAGQKVIPVAATAQFTAGEYCLIWKSDSVQEIGLIATVTSNTSVTMTTNLVNAFAENDLVIPLFTNVAFKSGTLGDGKHLDFYAYPDRAIAL